jgi:hypothetical protein
LDTFDQRVAALCRLLGVGLMAGCQLNTEPGGATVEDCTNPSGNFFVASGYVEVEPGVACPPARTDLELTFLGDCCPVQEWQGVTCEFVQRVVDDLPVTSTDTDWSTADTGQRPEITCEYTGVFKTGQACCGRPLLAADGHAIVAGVRVGTAWITTRTGAARVDLERPERENVAAYWLGAARLEHASIGSFARFTLELLQLGAPAELLRGAQQAALDEVRHAELCFGLATRMCGEPVGPTALNLDEATSVSASRADFAEAVAREGCVGETLAALDAAARLVGTTDPDVRAALEAIAEDESRHAALAWRTLRWLLSDDADGTVRDRLRHVFATQPMPDPALAEPTPGERSYGMLTQAEQRRVFADGWQRVVLPAWVAMVS